MRLSKNPARSTAAIAALVEALADPEEFVRWQTVKALAAQESSGVFPALMAALEDRDPLRRAGAAEALGCMGGEAVALALYRRLGDEAPQVRSAAARALGHPAGEYASGPRGEAGAGKQGQVGDPDSVPRLLPLLGDDSPEVRRAAAAALGCIASPAGAGPLAALLTKATEPLLVRRAVAAALMRAAHHDIQPQLLAALADPDPQVRGYAAEALGQVGDEAAIAPLKSLLSDGNRLLCGTVGDQAKRALATLERHGRSMTPAANPSEAR